MDSDQIGAVIERARAVAIEYYRLTGRPLGITGEVGEYEAARLLHLTLANAREAGYDATDANGRKLQIKARSLPSTKKVVGRLGSIKLEQPWDAVLLVLMNEEFRPLEIYEAGRDAITKALREPGSRARNERGALGIAKFKCIGTKVWTAT